MPGRHSLFWRLALVLCLSAVVIVACSRWVTIWVANQVVLLSDQAKAEMLGYAHEAEAAWRAGGEQGVAAWLAELDQRVPGEAMVVDTAGRSLSGTPLTDNQIAGFRFQRELDWRMSFRYREMPFIGMPFPGAPDQGRLVMQLPPEHMPGGAWPLQRTLILTLLPGIMALLAVILIYWRIMVPLRALEAQVHRFRDEPASRVETTLTERRDEFGELGRSFNSMAERVSGLLASQRQLLHDMSHELRTPLSRLNVALDSPLDEPALRQRVATEVDKMRTLVDDTLALVWHDTEQRGSETGPLSVREIWDLVVDDAAFESGWDPLRFRCQLPEHAMVLGNLNDFALTLENLVRNAIRHSPVNGEVVLHGNREGQYWHLWLADQGPGVPEERLESIFAPFVRLDPARTTDSGFGLGLSIARRAVIRQAGQLWAENGHPGLRVHVRLAAAGNV